MKTIIRRLRRLEERAAGPYFSGPNPVEVLWERRRQRLQREGVPVEELPPPLPPPAVGDGNPLTLTLSVAETLRVRQEIRKQQEAARALGMSPRDIEVLLMRRAAGLPV
jgi:hypothetical protein